MRTQFFQLIKITPLLCSALLFCLYQGASHHDNGIPTELTPQQTEQCVQYIAELQASYDQVFKTFDLFVDRPDQQTEMLQKLIEDTEQIRKLSDRLVAHPEAYSPSFKLPDDIELWIESRADVFQATTERFVAEITRRADSGEFDADSEGFLGLEKLWVEIYRCDDERDFCDPKKCKWCKLRQYWEMN